MIELEMFRGDFKDYDLAVTLNAAPADLTDCKIDFTAKRALADPDDKAVFHKSIGSGITVDVPTAGTAVIQIEHDDTAEMTRDAKLVWDVQVTDPAGKPHTVLRGTLNVLLDVTQAVPV